MFGSKVLEVGVGLSLLFLFVSLICTAIREMIEAVMKSRAMDLERGIRLILSDDDGKGFTRLFFDHPLIYSLSLGDYDPTKLKQGFWIGSLHMPKNGRGSLPSYIPAAQFAGALFDILARGAEAVAKGSTEAASSTPAAMAGGPAAAVAAGRMAHPGITSSLPDTTPVSIESLRQSVAKIENPRLQRALLTAIDNAQGELQKVKANLEQWYDGTMDRVAGWYKRRTQIVLFFLGLGAAVFLNMDAITIAQRLSLDNDLRKSVVEFSQKLQADTNKVENASGTGPSGLAELAKEPIAKLTADIAEIGYPIGWQGGWPKDQAERLGCPDPHTNVDDRYKSCHYLKLKPWPAFSLLLGWLITALAVTLGAPFWFDLLNKFMVIRSTVKPHEKSRQEGSKDAQDPAGSAARKSSRNGGGGNGGGGGGDGGSPPPDGNGSGTPTATDPALASLAAFQTTLAIEPHEWNTGDPREGVL